MRDKFQGLTEDDFEDAPSAAQPKKQTGNWPRTQTSQNVPPTGRTTAIAEEIEPSAATRAIAAFGGALQEPVLGAIEKAQLAFPGIGESGKQRISDIVSDRESRRMALSQLRETPAGQSGAFFGSVAPAVVAPPSIPAQMGLAGLLGTLKGGPDKPTGFGNEMMGSLVTGGIDAAMTGGLMKGAQLAGKGINAAMRNYSPEGRKLMDVNAAAERLGLTGENSPSINQLALGIPETQAKLNQQADILRKVLSTERQVPGVAPGTTEAQSIPGGVLREDLAAAVRARMDQAANKYQAVNELAQATGAGNITPVHSVPMVIHMQKYAEKGDEAARLANSMIKDYNPKALDWINDPLSQGLSQNAIKQAGIPVTTYHDTRVAVGKALNELQSMKPGSKTAPQSEAQEILQNLKNGLDSEADRWASKNSGNRKVMDAYNEAKQFYSDVVAPAVIENPLARKATIRKTPWISATDMYSAVTNPKNEELLARLSPTLPASGVDALTVLRGLPDVGKAMATNVAPKAMDRGALERAAQAALDTGTGHPLRGLSRILPGLSWASGRNPTVKRLYSAADPLQGVAGRPIAGGVQYLAEPAEDDLRRRLGFQ